MTSELLDKVIPKKGDRIARYEIMGELGRGGFGVVYKARQAGLDADVAIKLLIPQLSDQARAMQLLERFEQEARVIKQLEHPAALKVRDFGRWNGLPYLVTEYVRGTTLEDVLAREAPLPPARIGRIVRQVLGCLAEAHHHRIVHRDMKPGNIMLRDIFGEEDAVKVLDFGIAKVGSEGGVQTMTGMRFGTPWYMAPEQCRGLSDLDGRLDLYALGLIMAECITGLRVVQATDMMGAFYTQANHDPLGFDAAVHQSPLWPIIQAATQKERDLRYPDALSMRRALDSLMGTGSLESWPAQSPAAHFVPPPTLITPLPPVSSSAPAPVGLTSSAVVLGPDSPGVLTERDGGPAESSGRGRQLTLAALVLGVVLAGAWVVLGPGRGTTSSPDDGAHARRSASDRRTGPAMAPQSGPPRELVLSSVPLSLVESPATSGAGPLYVATHALTTHDFSYGCLRDPGCELTGLIRHEDDTRELPEALRCRAGEPDERSLNCLSQAGAETLCEHLGMRLPSAAEVRWAAEQLSLTEDLWQWTRTPDATHPERAVVYGGARAALGPESLSADGFTGIVRSTTTPPFMGARCVVEAEQALRLAGQASGR
jgi:serine/threonine protein kinase